MEGALIYVDGLGKEPLAVYGKVQVLHGEGHCCDLLREPGDGRSLNTSGTRCVEGVWVSHTTGRQGKGNISTGKVSAFGTGEVCRRNLAWLNTLHNLQQVLGFLSEDKGTASSKSPF